jgi:hypothetical protein
MALPFRSGRLDDPRDRGNDDFKVLNFSLQLLSPRSSEPVVARPAAFGGRAPYGRDPSLNYFPVKN